VLSGEWSHTLLNPPDFLLGPSVTASVRWPRGEGVWWIRVPRAGIALVEFHFATGTPAELPLRFCGASILCPLIPCRTTVAATKLRELFSWMTPPGAGLDTLRIAFRLTDTESQGLLIP